MTAGYEIGRAKLEKLIEWYTPRMEQRNEATTRFQLIDTLFFECLGWRKEDSIFEDSHEGEYADYTFLAPRKILIVEAKKENNYFELPIGKGKLEYSLMSLMRDHANLKDAIRQVTSYCQSRGVPFAAVSNGHQLVVFVAIRSDGIPPLSGKAFVFPSLPFMLAHFLELWQVLSKPAIEQQTLYARLIGSVIPELPPKLSSSIGSYPGVVNRNPFQADLQTISELVIEDLVHAENVEDIFLEECYAQSGALSQYSLISKSILEARYVALFDSEAPGPAITPASTKEGISAELLAESLSRRPILLIGDVGVGKTTFLRNLITIVAPKIFAQAIHLYIDLGSQASLSSDLKKFVLEEIKRQLRDHYELDVEEDRFIRGVYNLELQRFRKGLYGRFRESDPHLFELKEVEFLEKKVAEESEFLKDVLEHVVKGRRKQVVIFLDNADQRDEDIQQQVFLISQELATNWTATIFVALRPETYYRSLKVGALSGYHPKAFTISPPRIDIVLEKRLNFALKITSGEIPISMLQSSISVRLDTLDTIIRVFLDSLKWTRAIHEFIDNIPGGNVRLALDLVKGFFGSGHVNTQKIVDIYEQTGSYYIPLHEFLRAVIFGDNLYYDPDRSPIANLFDASSMDEKEHFLLPLIIGLLTTSSNYNNDEGFVETAKVYEQLQGLGFVPEQIDASIIKGYAKKLIETGARRIPQPNQIMPQTLRATSVGSYHLHRLSHEFSYVDAMIVDTPIFDENVRKLIKDVHNIEQRINRTETFCDYLDQQWSKLDLSKAKSLFDWNTVSSDLKKNIEYIRSRS